MNEWYMRYRMWEVYMVKAKPPKDSRSIGDYVITWINGIRQPQQYHDRLLPKPA